MTLTDVARMRFEAISFFLLLLLLSAAGIMGIWNVLRRDFPRLPRMTYGRAVGMMSLWGLLFLLVLTMISGARELLTPGAWEKDGLTYKLPQQGDQQVVTRAQRSERLMALKLALWNYADARGGEFPADDRGSDIAGYLWQSPDLSRARYVYVPAQRADVGARPVAYEPTVFPSPRAVLTSDGQIRWMSDAELRQALSEAVAAAAGATP